MALSGKFQKYQLFEEAEFPAARNSPGLVAGNLLRLNNAGVAFFSWNGNGWMH
jgi:hypothetical protein